MALLGPVDYALLTAGFVVHIWSLACLIRRGALSRYFTCVLYLCSSLAVGIGRCIFLKTFGFASSVYFYYYFYSDALLIISLFFILMNLYAYVFNEMGVSQYVRAGAMLLLGGTAGVSYYMVQSSSDRLVTTFVNELAQNLYFVALVLTYVLWGAMVKLRENRTRLMQLVLSMGVYVSLFAASNALGNMYPKLPVWRYYFPLMDMWLPASWIFTFLKVPEEARIATGRIVARTQ